MSTARKAVLLVGLAAMIIAPLAVSPAGAANAPVTTCLTTAYVTSDQGPRGLIFGPDGTSTTALVVYFCAGGVNGVQVQPGTASTSTSHCLNSFPGVPAAHSPAQPSRDEISWLPLCATPIGVDHIGPNSNSVSLLAGPTCSWTTNGHAWFTLAGLDLNDFTCSNGFGGLDTDARSESVAALLINPLFNVSGQCPDDNPTGQGACWLNALSQGAIVAADPSV